MSLDTDAIAARLATITPYPWEWYDTGDREENAHLRGANGEDVCDFGNRAQYYPTDGVEPSEADAAFIASAPGDIAALLAEVATLKREYALLMESHQGMANENLRLGGIIQALREVLQPFATQAEQWDAVHVMPEWCRTEVALGDLRRARRVLEGGTEEPQE